MTSSIRNMTRLLLLAAFVLASGMTAAQAQDKEAHGKITPSVAELANRYPPGTINSDEKAAEALADVKKERAAVEARLKKAQKDCTRQFLVTKCRDEAKVVRRADRDRLKLIENEASRFQRQQKVVRRDEALAERRAKEEGEAPKRAREQEKFEMKEAQRAQRGGTGPGISGKPPLTPEERAANLEAYNKKMEEIEENREKVAERKAKNDAKRARKKEVLAKKKEKEARAAAAAQAEATK